MTPPPEYSRVKLCWVVVSIDGWCCITNFRPLGPFLLVELEFRWWGVCKVIIVSNPTRLRLCCGWVVVRLGFWQFHYKCDRSYVEMSSIEAPSQKTGVMTNSCSILLCSCHTKPKGETETILTNSKIWHERGCYNWLPFRPLPLVVGKYL